MHLPNNLSISKRSNILGIETSCDETSAAVLINGELRSVIISSQHFHSDYGGIVPELASRAHIKSMIPITEEALQKAGLQKNEIDAIAVTNTPGLMGSLLVGLNFAKGLALSLGIPLVGVHHIEAHIFSVLLEKDHPELPFIALIVSGGHTLLVLVADIGKYTIIGKTLDDAAGEAFDKGGKMMGLGYPAGPDIDRLAQEGDASFASFPRSMMHDDSYDFSFSGLKTSLLYYLRDNPDVLKEHLNDIAASFQRAIVEVLVAKTIRAAKENNIKDIVCAGGVSANSELRTFFAQSCKKSGMQFFSPRPLLSTDNAAMIALLGALKLERGITSALSLTAQARTTLEEITS
jgi:N6-L-threonylcarbamoyladenine synthase